MSENFPPRLITTGILALGTAVASDYFMLRAQGELCGRLAPLTVLATLAAFVMSLCFRQMSRFKTKQQRIYLVVCLLLAGATLFSDFRYVRRNRDLCDQLQQQLHNATKPSNP